MVATINPVVLSAELALGNIKTISNIDSGVCSCFRPPLPKLVKSH